VFSVILSEMEKREAKNDWTHQKKEQTSRRRKNNERKQQLGRERERQREHVPRGSLSAGVTGADQGLKTKCTQRTHQLSLLLSAPQSISSKQGWSRKRRRHQHHLRGEHHTKRRHQPAPAPCALPYILTRNQTFTRLLLLITENF